MKTLTIGEITLELKDFRKIRNAVVGVYAEIVIPTTAISLEEVNALFQNNQNDLIVTEEDGTTTIYSGYNKWDETRVKADFYTVTQICESEAIHLLNEARKQIATLEQEKTELQNTVNAQSTELQAHAKIIVVQNEQLDKQAQTINAQKEEITMLNDTLLEVLMG